MSIKVRMKVDTARLDNIIREAPSVADTCSFDAADWMMNYIKAHWSAKVPSDPYKPPAKITGELEKSLRIRRRGAGGRWVGRGNNVLAYELTADAVYAAALEFGKINAPNTIIRRPFMRPAVEAAKRRFASFFYPIIDPRTLVYNRARGFVRAYPHLYNVNIRYDSAWDASETGGL